MSSRTQNHVLVMLAVAGAYFVLGRFGLELATINLNTSPIWFPSGLALATVAILGVRVAPAIFIAALLTNITVDTPPLALLAIALGNMLEAVVGGKILR